MLEVSDGDIEQKRSELEKLEDEISLVESAFSGDSSPASVEKDDSIQGKPLTKRKMSRLLQKTLSINSAMRISIKDEEVSISFVSSLCFFLFLKRDGIPQTYFPFPSSLPDVNPPLT